MKKKKLKKLLRAALRKIEARTPIKHRPSKAKSVPPEVFSLMEKVKKQLEEIKKPVEYVRSMQQEIDITVFDYLSMDRTMSMMYVHPRLRT